MEVEEVFSGGEDSDFELDENILTELYKADNTSDKAKPNSIKDELRTKIQQRRVSEGQQELKIVFEPPKSYELTREEREKIQRRKHRNRLSANQSRINRQRKLENLTKDKKNLSAENQKLRADVDALQKFKVRLETVLKNHVVRCNMKENPTAGYFTNLLQDANSTDKPTEESTTDANSPSNIVPVCTIDGKLPYGTCSVPCNTTNAKPLYTSYGNECLPSNKETISKRYEDVNREHTWSMNNLDRTSLRNMPKEQKISLLKAYLKGHQTKPEVQNLIRQLGEMTRTEHPVQPVNHCILLH